MITTKNDTVKMYGKSTDTKPTDGVDNGQELVEIDTSDVYMYDAEGGEWVKKNSSVGGGALMVHAPYDEAAAYRVMDKTWQEIFNALAAGTPAYLLSVSNEDPLWASHEAITQVGFDDEVNLYLVSIKDFYSGEIWGFACENPTDYPSMEYWPD